MHGACEGTTEISGGSGLGLSDSSTDFKGTSSTTVDSTAFDIRLTANYYVRDNLAIGIRQGYSSKNTEYEDNSEQTLTSLSLVPGISLNLPLNDDASVLLSAGLMLITQTYKDDLSDEDGAGGGYSIGAALKYFVGDNISLNFGAESINYSVEYDDINVEIETSDLRLSAGASFYFF